MTAVQRLYDVCKASFTSSGPVSPEALQDVRAVLDSITPSDVGLQEEALVSRARGTSPYRINGKKGRNGTHRYMAPITYRHIHECESFSIGIFCMPASSIIPLHNHPGMTVLSKLLYGSVHARSYDWVNPLEAVDPSKGAHSKARSWSNQCAWATSIWLSWFFSSRKARLARLVTDREMSAPCDTTILYPASGGNIHSFKALTSCALLDVLAPPYSTDNGRHCSYYLKSPKKVLPSKGLVQANGINVSTSQLAWLEEYQPPDDFVVQRGLYKGPRVEI